MKVLNLVRNPRSTLLLVLTLVAELVGGQSAVAQDGPEITFLREPALISVRAVDVPLGEMRDAIGEATAIEIVKYGKHDTPVTIDLVEEPVKAALDQLLGRSNYTMKLDPQTGLPTKLWLMSAVDQHVITRMREVQQKTSELESTRKLPTATNVPPSLLSDQQRQQLRELRQSLPEKEAFAELGLNKEQQEQVSQMLDKLEAGGAILEGMGLSEEQQQAFSRMLREFGAGGTPIQK